jgi:hypothetical protein
MPAVSPSCRGGDPRGSTSPLCKCQRSRGLVLLLHIKCEVSQQEIQGYVALIMDIPSKPGLSMLAEARVRITSKAHYFRRLVGH